MWPGQGRPAWALVLAVLLSWLLAAGAVAMGVAPSAGPEDTTTAPGPFADMPDEARHLVLVGVPGLTWDLVDEERTPTLARLARTGGAAALVPRGRYEVTCAPDAWLTVGAGQRAGTDVSGCAAEDASRPAADVVIDRGVEPEAWSDWQGSAGREAMAPQLGTLAALAEEAGTCVAAYGREAMIGAARPDGTVAVSVPAEPGTFPSGVGEAVGRAAVGGGDDATTCRVHLVSTPEVQEGDPEEGAEDPRLLPLRGADAVGEVADLGDVVADLRGHGDRLAGERVAGGGSRARHRQQRGRQVRELDQPALPGRARAERPARAIPEVNRGDDEHLGLGGA